MSWTSKRARRRVKAAVIDDEGNPVAGLSVDDFEVFEDGELRELSLVLDPVEFSMDVALVLDFSVSVARALSRLVVVDEADKPTVDPLVVWNMGVRGVNPHRLAQDLRRRAARPHQLERLLGSARLIPVQDPLLESRVRRLGLAIRD